MATESFAQTALAQRRTAARRAADLADAWLADLATGPVAAAAGYPQMLAAFDEPMPDGPADPLAVVEELAARAAPGLTRMGSPRFYGFVVGGVLPAAAGADVLVGAWDQNAGLRASTPAAAAIEEVAGRWVLAALGLPPTSSVGFVTGGCTANLTCLAAARHRVLADAGWDVEARGLAGAPAVHLVVPQERHATVDLALRYLGFGAATARRVRCDDQGRLDLADLAAALAEGAGRPMIVTTAAGNVNTGAFDPLRAVVDAARPYRAWVHVDGAFGLWAAASPRYRHLLDGVAEAHSWATDAHKWLNTPYDCGIAMVADPQAQAGAFRANAAYLDKGSAPDPMDLVPEFSRRARGIPVWAALKSLGRSGVAELVERGCAAAGWFADGMRATDGAAVLNDVVLNQVLVRFRDDDEVTRAVTAAATASGRVFVSGTTWRGQAAMRFSVTNAMTTRPDVDAAAGAVRDALSAR